MRVPRYSIYFCLNSKKHTLSRLVMTISPFTVCPYNKMMPLILADVNAYTRVYIWGVDILHAAWFWFCIILHNCKISFCTGNTIFYITMYTKICSEKTNMFWIHVSSQSWSWNCFLNAMNISKISFFFSSKVFIKHIWIC